MAGCVEVAAIGNEALRVHSENVPPKTKAQKRSQVDEILFDPPAKRAALDCMIRRALQIHAKKLQRALRETATNGATISQNDPIKDEHTTELQRPSEEPRSQSTLIDDESISHLLVGNESKQLRTNVMVSLEALCPLDFYAEKDDLPAGVPDIDRQMLEDVNCDPHYAHDSFMYLREREALFLVKPYLKNDSEVSTNCRAVLVDWLIELQMDHQLNHEVLYTAVKTVDRYLSIKSVCRNELQLLAIGALLIACKLDNRLPAVAETIIQNADDLYTKRQILEMEIDILKQLDFDLSTPLSYTFLRRFCRCADLDLREMTLARFILESSLLDYSFVEMRESHMAAAALLLALDVLGKEWNDTLTYYTGYTPRELRCTRNRLHMLVEHFQKSRANNAVKVGGIMDKYSDKIFFKVANVPFPPLEELN